MQRIGGIGGNQIDTGVEIDVSSQTKFLSGGCGRRGNRKR